MALTPSIPSITPSIAVPRKSEIIHALRDGSSGTRVGSTDEVAEAVVKKMLALGFVKAPN